MPPMPPVANVVLARLKGTYGTGVWNVVHHLQYSGQAPSVADLNTIATSISTAYSANLQALAGTNVVLTGIDLADLTNPAASATSQTFTVAGTRVGATLPASTAVVTSWQINIRYRGGHPRSYWPFGVVTDLTNSRQFSTTFVTAAHSGVGAYRTALNALSASGTTYKMVTVSYRRNKEPRPTPLVFTINS